MEDSDKYKITIKQHGAAGWAFYVGPSRLPFSWEILGFGGVGILIPKPEEWEAYCDQNNANWAKGYRDLILDRLAKGVLKKRYGNGRFEIEPNSILIKPGSFLSRLFSFLR